MTPNILTKVPLVSDPDCRIGFVKGLNWTTNMPERSVMRNGTQSGRTL